MTVPRVSHGRAFHAIAIGPFTMTEAVYAPYQRVTRHDHEWPSWTLVLEGGFVERFSRSALVAQPGSVLSKPAPADHSNVYGPQGARCLLIETRDGEGDGFDAPMLHAAGVVPQLARRIQAELGATRAGPMARFSLEGLLIELGLATVRAQRAVRVSGRTAWLNGVREQLEAEFRAPPSLASLARARGVHPAYLCQAFRAAFGMSAGQFLRRVRFEWARDALRVGSASIADIAFAAGFSDQAHFSRDFRKRTGMSPRQFRAGAR
jgi:AraC family transcriptional regulator